MMLAMPHAPPDANEKEVFNISINHYQILEKRNCMPFEFSSIKMHDVLILVFDIGKSLS
jgi:hypothetical protein